MRALWLLAALPLAVGLSGDEYASAPDVHRAFGSAVILCAAVMAAGGLVAWLTVRTPRTTGVVAPTATPQCTVNCGMLSPPLEPRDGDAAR